MSNTPTARRPQRPDRSSAQTAAAAVRALASLTVLCALLAGLPVLLWWATAQVGPPGLAALSHLLSTEDSGQVFLLLLAVAGWAGWACFACSVLLEIPAQLRGRAAPQIRGLVGQRAAAALVGAVLLALPTTTALAAPASAAPVAQPVQVSAAPVPGAENTRTPSISTSAPTSGTAPAYTVRDARPAESLWSIADQVLGDGQRWEEIAALNEGRTMADGSVFHAQQPIQPGWTLHLPADAHTAPAAGPAPQQAGTAGSTAPATHTVQEGESLSGIAAEQLGDAGRYGEIFDLNKGRALPGGGTFTDPDLIRPGQPLSLPQPGTAAPAPAAQPQPDTAPPVPPAATPTPPPTASTAQPTPAPAASSSSTPGTPPATNPAPPPTQSAPTPAAPHATDSRSTVAMVAGIGTLLAASLAATLGVRRILQQRRRRAGQTIAQDSDPSTLEQVIGATGTPEGLELLDRVLRTLARHAADTEQAPPPLRGATLTGRDVVLLLDEPAEPIAPFTAGPDSRSWTLDPAAALPDTEELRDVEAPYPGLVTLGAHGDGLLLADLTTCRVLLLEGTDEEVLEVARAIALELGTCAWTDYSEILTTGLGSRLARLLPQGRIRTMPHLPAVAADLGELMLEAHQSGEQVLPWLTISAADHDGDHLAQLADAIAAARHLKTAAVLPASDAARRCFPHAEVLDVTRDQNADYVPLALPVTLQRISDEQYRQYVHALEVSVQDPAPSTGPWEFAESHGQPAASGRPLTVRSTVEGAQDPGNPFPALLVGASAPAASSAPPPQPAPDDSPAEEHSTPATAASTASPAPLPSQTPREEPQPATSDVQHGGVRIEMLGALRITGGTGSAHAHAPRTTAVAALIHLRPGRSAEYLCKAVDPVTPWSTRTLHSRLSELRSELGLTADGRPLLPRPKDGGYVFHPSVTSDWDLFQQLATRGLAAGPKKGTADLESALALVRGRPFDGRTLPWADPVVQEMLSRITDTAHTLARWHTDAETPDLDAARRTVVQALDIEETSEVLYRDLLMIESAAGNEAAIRGTVARLQQMARTYDITLDGLTEDTIDGALSGRPFHVSTG
ncbi:LysM peptidoglycan-binding domain-containing protein [Streptomyces xanthophaeus]|uniref:LysM peptidoglycan-binding domain-containing protein n=1 Tax=Streptomyces xanthophaeus TaxID=67385 RepID=UPI00371106AE